MAYYFLFYYLLFPVSFQSRPQDPKRPRLTYANEAGLLLISCNKEIKNVSECIVELYKHVGIFKNTREVHREA